MCKSSYIVQIFGDDLTYLDVNKKASLNTCVQNTPHTFWAVATRDNPYLHSISIFELWMGLLEN